MAQSSVFLGVIWSLSQRFGTMIISFVSNVILARLLTPDDFGMIGMLMLFIAVANTFVDSGLGSALIQRKEISQADKSTVFFANLFISLLIYVILFLASPWIADFYNMPFLKILCRVQSLVLVLQAFCVVQTSLLIKYMDFKKLAVCNLFGSSIGAIIGIILALNGAGVWSLAIKTISTTFFVTISLWFVSQWKPSLIFCKESFKSLFGFGGFILLSSLMMNVANNVQTLILGKLFPPYVLGNYTQARNLRNVASESLSSVIGQVLYPNFSKMQDDNKSIICALHRSTTVVSFVMSPLMLLCVLIAGPVFYLLFGEKWLNAVPYFQILCISGIFASLQDININVVKAKGKSKILFYCNLVKTGCLCLMLVFGASFYGIYGLLWAMVLYSFLAFVVFAKLSSIYIESNLFDEVKIVLTNVVVSLVPFVLIHLFFEEYCCENFILEFLLKFLLYITCFLGLSYVLKIPGYKFIKEKLSFRRR